MKKIIAIASAAALLSAFAMPSMAAKKSPEEACKVHAEKDKISADKMDAYLKTCVEKHNRHHGHTAKPADTAASTAK
ncbi:MAG: hypothetical protein HY272_00160 [Gammaproteobacteria bacterium]|nr:hypothetical protein [Gammaproteobacteria bacterium]